MLLVRLSPWKFGTWSICRAEHIRTQDPAWAFGSDGEMAVNGCKKKGPHRPQECVHAVYPSAPETPSSKASSPVCFISCPRPPTLPPQQMFQWVWLIAVNFYVPFWNMLHCCIFYLLIGPCAVAIYSYIFSLLFLSLSILIELPLSKVYTYTLLL